MLLEGWNTSIVWLGRALFIVISNLPISFWMMTSMQKFQILGWLNLLQTERSPW
uniref:Uncharacterized protein n=1 Tax=Rhizophora mucronata TaxID=61149 RepID=A0A2P2N2B3_RHIMU